MIDRAENELLLCCARTDASPELVTRLRELAASDVDWDYLMRLARRHSILPLLYRLLERHASELVPSDVLAELKLQYQENHARNTILGAELCRVINLFNDHGVE